MAKGVSIKFQSYGSTVGKLLEVIKFDQEIKKHNKIILKPSLRNLTSINTPVEFTEAVLKFCLSNKNPDASVFIAEGSDGESTDVVFQQTGYKNLAEKYGIGLIDLNNAEAEEVFKSDYLKFDSIMYPKVLLESFVVSLPKLALDEELEMNGSLANMIGAFPAKYYKGLFSKDKSKIRRWPLKFSLYDLSKCKTPDLAIIDASEQGYILAGVPMDMDQQAAKLLGKEWKTVSHLRMIAEGLVIDSKKAKEAELAKEPTENPAN
ncbi:MAG: DUF362 domain-containing protein [archaeon]